MIKAPYLICAATTFCLHAAMATPNHVILPLHDGIYPMQGIKKYHGWIPSKKHSWIIPNGTNFLFGGVNAKGTPEEIGEFIVRSGQ